LTESYISHAMGSVHSIIDARNVAFAEIKFKSIRFHICNFVLEIIKRLNIYLLFFYFN
jgi:hypothetical protein